MKLIKLSEEHYIVVDDSEIKEGDFVYSSDGGIFKRHIDNPCQTVFSISKITHSTQPLYKNDFWAIQELKLSEVKELVGEVDVEKRVTSFFPLDCKDLSMYKFGIDMYNQALEDNKEKKYTERDLWRAFDSGKAGKMALQFYETLFQPKTEWEVEIVDGKLKLKQ